MGHRGAQHLRRSETSETPEGLTQEQATEIARRAILDPEGQREFVLLEEETVEREFGWVFRYQTKRFVETGDLTQTLPGVGPFVVEREGGKVVFLTTSVVPDEAIEGYEADWRAAREGA